MKKITDLLLILTLIAGLTTACSKENPVAPALPPAESMTIDFSNFITEKKRAPAYDTKGIETASWTFSAHAASYWNSLMVTTLPIPVIAYGQAEEHSPVYLENNTWEWKYDIQVFTATYRIRLTGRTYGQNAEWKMYVSREESSSFSEFLWLEGISKLDGSGGQWILNHCSYYNEPVIQIDWTGDGTDIQTVKYTYIRELNDSREDDPFLTSFIEYGKRSGGTYDAYYLIHYFNGTDFLDVEVEWNTADRYGRVRCEAFFADDEWHCWNGNYINIFCPL
ncbi:MAG: hypothetical protein GX158_00750 [Bacteroidales bacterium]|nr:hypothetical protein [Bacteroidales bacterium]